MRGYKDLDRSNLYLGHEVKCLPVGLQIPDFNGLFPHNYNNNKAS